MPLEIGTKVPNIILNDQYNKTFNLYDHLGDKVIVLYFYPKDNTPVCRKEACTFQDNHAIFEKLGAMVVGISSDTTESHLDFANNNSLTFRLLSDPYQEAIKAFQVKNTLFITGRETFIIDKNGILQYKYRSALNAKKHVENALATVKRLQKG